MKKIDKFDLQHALARFADELGLKYSPFREEICAGKIKEDLLPGAGDLETEVTKESKDAFSDDEYFLSIGLDGQNHIESHPKVEQQATLLGKVNAIAEFLGLEFEVSPEKVIAEKVTAKKNKAKK